MDEIMSLAGAAERSEEVAPEQTFNEWMLSFGRARLDWKRWTEGRQLLASKQESANSKVFKHRIAALSEQDEHLWKKLAELNNGFNSATDTEFERQVFKIFNVVFKKMRSKNIDLNYKIKIGSSSYKSEYKLVAGPNGFGKRYNIQATTLDRADLWAIIGEKEEVAAALRKAAMPEYADKLIKFAEMLPDLKEFNGESVRIALNQKVLVPPELKYSSTELSDSLPRMCSYVEIDERGSMYLYADEEDGSKGEQTLQVKRVKDNYGYHDSDRRAERSNLVYWQVSPQLPQIVNRYEQIVSPVIAQSKESISKLRAAFGRELLMDGV